MSSSPDFGSIQLDWVRSSVWRFSFSRRSARIFSAFTFAASFFSAYFFASLSPGAWSSTR